MAGAFHTVDPKFIHRVAPFLDGLYRHYFRCRVSGLENVPRGAALYVGNHNGLVAFEVLMLFYAWWKRFGLTKPALGLAHTIAVNHPIFRWFMPKIGAIPAEPKLALRALEHGYSLLTYPGGMKELFRPFKDRKKIEFFDRKGFIKIALEANVPIVPIVSVGAHESYIILNRGEALAKRLGIYDKLRVTGIPITFRAIFFMWCVASGFFTFFPWLIAPAAFASIFVPMPAKMTFKILPPIDPKALWKDELTRKQNIDRIYYCVTSTMQSVLTAEYKKRKVPILG